MDVKNIYIKGIPSSEFNDNEYLENALKELEAGGVNVVLSKIDDMINWGRSNSIWPLIYATSCCGIEFMSTAAAHHDISRFGMEVTRNSPRQADLMIVAGTMVHKMAPLIKRVYDQMAEPKYVIAMGACAISGGPFVNSYHVVNGVDQIIPVDVYIPGCPPRPEAIFDAIVKLRKKVANESIQERGTVREQTHRYYSITHNLKTVEPILTGKYLAQKQRNNPPLELTEAMGMEIPPALQNTTVEKEMIKGDRSN